MFVLPGYAVMPDYVIDGVVLLQTLLIGASLILSIKVGASKPFERWMKCRGLAENARVALFDEVMKATQPGTGHDAGAIPLLPLQLEYFRRYQLDVQRSYYRGRGGQHRLASQAARNWRIAALLILVASMFPMVWALSGVEWVPAWIKTLFPNKTLLAQQVFLGVGLIASGLQGLLAAYAVISLNDRNAVRYLATADNLDDLEDTPLREARTRAASGDRSGVLTFVALAQQEIASEHREWIALRTVAPDLSLDCLATLRLPKLH